MRTHRLKSWKHLFEPMWNGDKTYDLRLNDRDYKVGDIVHIYEYDGIGRFPLDRSFDAEITYITQNLSFPCVMSPVALGDNYCILSLKIKERFYSE